jgi:hypothetical protein
MLARQLVAGSDAQVENQVLPDGLHFMDAAAVMALIGDLGHWAPARTNGLRLRRQSQTQKPPPLTVATCRCCGLPGSGATPRQYAAAASEDRASRRNRLAGSAAAPVSSDVHICLPLTRPARALSSAMRPGSSAVASLETAFMVGGRADLHRMGRPINRRCLRRRSIVRGIAPDPGSPHIRLSAPVRQGSEFPFSHGLASASPIGTWMTVAGGYVIAKRPPGRQCAGLAARGDHDLDRDRWS